MRAQIIGTGSYVPEKVVTNRDLEKIVETSDEWIVERTGIRERRQAAPGENTSDMALKASIRALEMASTRADELDLIIVGTISPDMPMPACAAFLAHKLGATKCFAFDLSAACAGSLFGMSIASQFIETGRAKRVLVVGVELLTRIVDWKDRNSCVLFGDAAGAMVLGPSKDEGRGVISTHLHTDGSQTGILCIPGGGMSSEARLRVILDNAATVLCCTPTYAIRLGEVAAQNKMDISRSGVKRIIVAGEPGGSIHATRRRIETLWSGASVFDHHGMTETGPVTYECPARPGVLHVMESAFYAEVIDPATGKPVPAGELVLTTLTRTGSPLLRYRTGDLVRRDLENPVCSCGRHEIALGGGVHGRVDDMVIVRGVNIYPGSIDTLFQGLPDVAEYRVHVNTKSALAELRVEVEPVETCKDTEKLAALITNTLQIALSLRVPVTIVAPGTLPRSEMKAKRWVKG